MTTRRATHVRISQEDFIALKQLFNTASEALKERLNLFVKNAEENLTDHDEEEATEVIKAARKIYSGDDVEVDGDATFSETDDGIWVSGWLWVEGSALGWEKEDEDAS